MIRKEDRLRVIIQAAQGLSSGQSFDKIFKGIMRIMQQSADAEGGSLYIYDKKAEKLKGVLFTNDILNIEETVEEFDPLKITGLTGLVEVDMRNADGELRVDTPSVASFINREIVEIENLQRDTRFDFTNTQKFDKKHNYKTRNMIIFPLLSHNGESIGVLQIINPRKHSFNSDYMDFIKAITAQVGLALTNALLVCEGQNLLSSVVNMIVVAIDEKSTHTSGHCRRVTELTMMIADALVAEKEGKYKDFSLSKEDRRELYLAALLHDVGKVVTPTHILEKPTKLFALHDRIELLSERLLAWQLSERYDKLVALMKEKGYDDILSEVVMTSDWNDDIEFLKKLNTNGISINNETCEHLNKIGQRIINKQQGNVIPAEEMNNLKIKSGTLNKEERKIMEEHVNISIRLLSSIPWPKNLERVVEYAGAHHENLNGTGYPLNLTKKDLSLPARILGLADRFEGISAPDRPYRKTKMTLSAALGIMRKMREDEHIDSDLFDYFIEHKIYLDYANTHLPSELIDCD